jgi:hypothetical protein
MKFITLKDILRMNIKIFVFINSQFYIFIENVDSG